MENDSSLNATINESALVLVPIGAVAFAPFLLLELVAAVVSNAILLALVILACVKKLNNNINIYLFSLAVGGLIGAIDIFCLLSLVVARRWVLGFVLCNISNLALNLYAFISIFLYLVISRDKLKGVKDPLHGRPTIKKAYINSVIIWTATSCAGIAGYSAWVWSIIRNSSINYGNFFCFALHSVRINDRSRFIIGSFSVISFLILSTTVIMITVTNFVRILLELRELKKLRQRFANESSQISNTIKINGRDKPLYRTGEERTAKSLTLVCFIQFICTAVSYIMYYTQTIRNFVLPPERGDGPDFQIYFLVQLTILFFPCVNPIFLILSNKRLRTRVKELFKCTLSPEVEASPVHVLTPKKTESTRAFLDLKTNKITPITKDENIQ
jgi:hypothetical protein